MSKIIIGLLIGIAISFVLSRLETFTGGGREEEVVVRIDTLLMIDTVVVERPVVRDSIVVQTITRHLVVHDTVRITEPDSVTVEVPIEQKHYETEDYAAWVSGYEARLDSLKLLRPTVIIEKEIIRKKPPNRWGCTVGVGAGLGLHDASPLVGVVIGYRLF